MHVLNSSRFRNKAEDLRRSLRSRPPSPTANSRHQEQSRGRFRLCVGSWNIRAYDKYHGVLELDLDVSEGSLSSKISNLAKTAKEQSMDLCVLQECPGSKLKIMEGAIREILAKKSDDPDFYFAGNIIDPAFTAGC